MQTITEQPARGAGAISRQLAVQERRARKASQRVRKLREIASAEIERLIAFLDQTDGYTMTEQERDDAEPTVEESRRVGLLFDDNEENEPSLGWGNGLSGQQYPTGSEHDTDLEGDGSDDESSLAAAENHPSSGSKGNQSYWAQGQNNDCEVDDSDYEDTCDREDVCEDEGAEHDGAEPDEDREPSLGWPEAYGCGGAGMGSSDDKEEGAGPDIAGAKKRGRSNNPGVSVHRHYSRCTKITGLTDQQKKMLGTEWVR